MKGDFTRFTFQPQKHYSSVLMQQGRLQLDADWNEQMSILNYLNQIQARDIIGSAAGTSQSEGGYQILPAIDHLSTSSSSEALITDFLITEGRFYIDGILCELNRGTSIPVEWRSDHEIQVPTLTLDGRLFAPDQWVELEVPEAKRIQIRQHKILTVRLDSFTLKFQEEIPEPQAGKSIKLRLLTTYKTQADYTKPETPSPQAPLFKEIYAVYLDVWQRHITALDDRHLQEVALNGLDTTTRLKTIAQVKLLDITKNLTEPIKDSTESKQAIDFDPDPDKFVFRKKPASSDLTALPAWQALNTRSVSMTATTASNPNSAIDTSGSYQGGDNRLYRVEIHQAGAIDQATFKWSRDNGSIVSAIAKIEGDVVFLKGSIQDEYKLFGAQSSSQSKENPWIEIITEAQELSNQPGILVQIRDVKPPNLLLLDLSQLQGTSLPEATLVEAEQQKLKVRRWESQAVASASWKALEQGIQIQFATGSGASFKTGDYWLISARSSQPIEWPRDLPQAKQQLGKPIAQPPAGIQHRYGILAVVKAEAQNGAIIFSSAVDNDDPKWVQSDLRTKFLPLIDRGNSSGIGTQPEARFHVRGDDPQTATGKIRKIGDNPPTIEISETEARIFKGYTISIADKTALVIDANNTGVLRLTLDTPLDALPEQEVTTFRYQQPVIRFETNTATTPQFFLNGTGNIGINTFNPAAKFELHGIATEPSIDLLQIKDATGKSLFNIQSDGKVGIGIDPPQANLDVRDRFRITAPSSTSPAFLQIQPQAGNPILFVSNSDNPGYSFDRKLIVQTGGITVQNSGGANISGQLVAQNGIAVEAGGITAKGDISLRDASGQERLTVKGNNTTIAGEVTIKTVGTDRISVRSTGTTVNGNVTLATGNLVVENGTVTVGDLILDDSGLQVDRPTRFNTLTVRQALTLGNSDFKISGTAPHFNRAVTFAEDVTVQGDLNVSKDVTVQGDLNVNLSGREKITLSHPSEPVTIDLPNQTLLIQSGNRSIAEISTFQTPNNPKLNLAGNAVIGAGYVDSPNGLTNGLLVQGHVGIGLFDRLDGADQLSAKLEVRGATNNANDAALNITNQSRDSLFYVQNDGQVYIATNDLKPTIKNITEDAKNQTKLYVEGNAYLNGNLFAQEAKVDSITGGKIEQLSSRTLKENIIDLSSQEAAEMLRQLNPVKFNYTLPSDRTLHTGFIAEDVPELLTSPDRQAVRLLDVVAVLTKTVKDQREGIFLLNRMVKQQQAAIAALTEKITQLENQAGRDQ